VTFRPLHDRVVVRRIDPDLITMHESAITGVIANGRGQ